MTEHTHKVLAIIPARAGSKRLPGKNTRTFLGKPLIQWTIDLAKKAKQSDLVIVTSDDPKVLNLAVSSNCMTIARPAILANDTATTFDVIKHALETLALENIYPQFVLLLQPTSPLRQIEDINNAFLLLEEKESNSVISVSPVDHSPLWCNQLDENLSMDYFLPFELLNKRSQDFSVYYRLNGALYLAKTSQLLRYGSFFMPNSHALIMPKERSIDIDDIHDFFLSEQLMKAKQHPELMGL